MTQTATATADDARTYTLLAQDDTGRALGKIEISLGRHPWTYVGYLSGTFTTYPTALVALCDRRNFEYQLRTAARDLVFRDAVDLWNDSTDRHYIAPQWVDDLGVIWKPNNRPSLLFRRLTRLPNSGGYVDEAIVFQHDDADCDLWLGDEFENLPDAIAKRCTEQHLAFGAHRPANKERTQYVIASNPELVRQIVCALKKADEPLSLVDFTTETYSSAGEMFA